MKKIFTSALFLSLLFTTYSQELQWGYGFTGVGVDRPNDICVDGNGNAIVAGLMAGTIDFDPGPGETIFQGAGFGTAFVQKFDPSGNLLWAHVYESGNGSEATGVDVDADGNVYLVGTFAFPLDFDLGPNETILTPNGMSDVFVLKLDANGNFVWAKSFGDFNTEDVHKIDVTSSGNVHIVGDFFGTVDFDPGAGTTVLSSTGENRDIYYLKLDSGGNFDWAGSITTIDYDEGYDIAANSDGDVYITGFFTNTGDFDPGEGVYEMTPEPSFNSNAFVLKVDIEGDFEWAVNIGGGSLDHGFGITTDANGNVIVAGDFTGTPDFDPGAGVAERTSAGGADIFTLKLDGDGNFVWVSTQGGQFDDVGYGVTSDNAGNVYTTGLFLNTVDFNPGADQHNLTSYGDFSDVFVQKLDVSGNFISARNLTGTWSQSGIGVAVDADQNCYVIGQCKFTIDLDPGAAEQIYDAGENWEDYFIVKLDDSIADDIEEVSTPSFISAYPNPSNGTLYIRVAPGVNQPIARVLNAVGEIVMETRLTASSLNTIEIEIPGVYFIQVEDLSGKTETTKVVVSGE